jgi:hypothetical protein
MDRLKRQIIVEGMKNNGNNLNKSFINVFDEIFGLDIFSFHFNEHEVVGYLYESPIQERIISKFNYKPSYSSIDKKPYRAHWMIHDSKLLLGYVNGIIEGVRFYTDDIVPEFLDEDILCHYHWFTGHLKLNIQQKNISTAFDSFLINETKLLLTFEKGYLKEIGNKVTS